MAPIAIEQRNDIINNKKVSKHLEQISPNTCRDEDVHDLLCIGFGPASLAIAVALHDLLEENASKDMKHEEPKVKFLEKQVQFGWHAGMLLPGTKMQISFLKDLATLRDPRSKFTFLNYLKCNNRLVQFSNLDTFLPLRLEFEDYLRWAASHFEHLVEYSSEVLSVHPVRESEKKYQVLEVTSQNVRTGQLTSHKARNVVIAVGGRPSCPPPFPSLHDLILHSSEYNHKISHVLPDEHQNYRIAIVGSGQSAAEIFNDLQSRYPQASTRLIIRDTALRPSDDSPFVNEVFNPEAVNDFYQCDSMTRDIRLRNDKATNYSVVRLNLLEAIYQKMYCQRIKEPESEKWQHQILTSREIVEVIDNQKSNTLTMVMTENNGSSTKRLERVEVDAVILATGYLRDVHLRLLEHCQQINSSADGRWEAGRNYQVNLDRDQVDDKVGIYLQGCNEQTHGLSDSLLSILATRSGELVKSIFKST